MGNEQQPQKSQQLAGSKPVTEYPHFGTVQHSNCANQQKKGSLYAFLSKSAKYP